MINFSIGYSPCPNDTFIFDALINKRIASDLYSFDPSLLDVEALNNAAKIGKYDITKLSYSAFAFVSNEYQILNSGSALGNGCGPLLISKKPYNLDDLKNLSVAIPGKYTTANLLMNIFVPNCKEKKEMVFSEIEDAVLNEDCDVGLIIHENRFTYAAKGLFKIADMGELWELKTGLPIPLGCIAIRRNIAQDVKIQISRLIKESIVHAFNFPVDSEQYISQHASEMSTEVQKQHIALYVNEFSIDLGVNGKMAINHLLDEGIKCGLLPVLKEPIFV